MSSEAHTRPMIAKTRLAARGQASSWWMDDRSMMREMASQAESSKFSEVIS
jgi:hypothetical protein